MKIITSFLLSFIVITSQCMEDEHIISQESTTPESSYVTLEELISRHIFRPKFIKRELDKLQANTLRSYHYGAHNGVLHCLVENLVAQKHSPRFDDLVERHKPIFRTLVYDNGLSVNDVNDHHMTPLMLAYVAQKETKNIELREKITPLINFLQDQLHANPTYFSIAPEIRFFKQIAWEFVTCQCCPLKYKQQ